MKSIKSSQDLVTKKEDTIKGFKKQAEEKLKITNQYIDAAKKFEKILNECKSFEEIKELIKDNNIKPYLISALGFSEKSSSHIKEEIDSILAGILDDLFLDDNIGKLKEKLIAQFLLIKGDSMGGTIRNLTGNQAGQELAKLIQKKLDEKKIKYEIVIDKKNSKCKEIFWQNRRIYIDKKPPKEIFDKNIDIILVKENTNKKIDLTDPKIYLACGELKGGIDPAGADEHWKTAKTALERIYNNKNLSVKLCFIGAAIEKSMATEIFELLNSGWLSTAANFNYDNQTQELIEWLISL